jgi:hypothetical protein
MPSVLSEQTPAARVAARGGGAEPERLGGSALAPFDYPARAVFTYLANPGRWDIFETEEGPEILPAVREFSHQPGSKGVRPHELRDGRIVGDPGAAIARLESAEGWIKIDDDVEVVAFGARFSGAVHVYEGRRGRINLPRWVRLYRLGGAVHVERDVKGWIEFLRYVRDSVLPPIDAGVLLALESKLRTDLGRVRSAGKASHVSAHNAEILEGRLLAFKASAPASAPTGGAEPDRVLEADDAANGGDKAAPAPRGRPRKSRT